MHFGNYYFFEIFNNFVYSLKNNTKEIYILGNIFYKHFINLKPLLFLTSFFIYGCHSSLLFYFSIFYLGKKNQLTSQDCD